MVYATEDHQWTECRLSALIRAPDWAPILQLVHLRHSRGPTPASPIGQTHPRPAGIRLEGAVRPSEELRAIFEADQDRLGDVFSPDLADRDRVTELLAAAAATPDDLYHAAMVFQHGDNAGDWRRAHELALRSAELGHSAARWLAAAAHDRWLMVRANGRNTEPSTGWRRTGGSFTTSIRPPPTLSAPAGVCHRWRRHGARPRRSPIAPSSHCLRRNSWGTAACGM